MFATIGGRLCTFVQSCQANLSLQDDALPRGYENYHPCSQDAWRRWLQSKNPTTLFLDYFKNPNRKIHGRFKLNQAEGFFSGCFLGCIKRYSSLPYFGFTPPTQDVWMCFCLVLFLTDSTMVKHCEAISTIWENILWFTFSKQF